MDQLTHRNRVNRTIGLTVFLLVGLLSPACSSSSPSESDGRAFLENVGKKQGLFTVKSFTKTNAVDQGGMYMLEYEAEVECLRVNYKAGDIVFAPGKYHVSCQKIGDIEHVKGSGIERSMRFEKTEKGWRGEDGNIY